MPVICAYVKNAEITANLFSLKLVIKLKLEEIVQSVARL